MMSARTEGGEDGQDSVDKGEGVNFSQFCADVFYGQTLNCCIFCKICSLHSKRVENYL